MLDLFFSVAQLLSLMSKFSFAILVIGVILCSIFGLVLIYCNALIVPIYFLFVITVWQIVCSSSTHSASNQIHFVLRFCSKTVLHLFSFFDYFV